MVKDTFQGIPRLTADEGKVLTNGVNYCNTVLISRHDSEDNWQEVDLTEIPVIEEYTYGELRMVRETIQEALIYIPNETILKAPYMANEWKADTKYVLNAVVRYEGIPYRCIQAHTSQTSWTPDVSPSLWAKILTQEGEILAWEQPDSTNGYMKGDKVTHNGKTYESLVDNNVWEPGATGTESLWSEVN